MKILMLGWELPPHNSGGLGVACHALSKALALEGASIDFVVPYDAHHPEMEYMTIHPATRLSPLERYGLNAYDSSQDFVSSKESDDRSGLTDMRSVQKRYVEFVEELVETIQPEAIHAHDWLTIEAGVRAKEITGVPLIVHVHATEFDRCGDVSGNPIVHEIEYMGLMMADKIIAVSQITKNIIIEKYGIPADKIEVVHNAIDISNLPTHHEDLKTYKYLESLKEEGYTIVATVTRFTIQKGLTHMLRGAARASEKYEKFAFLFAGDGEQRDEMIALAAQLGISDKVFFTGFVRGQQWRDAYRVADVFVMGSVSEPFGLTALEAAHYDNALMISKQSGVGEILNSIYRFDYWDVDRMADQLVAIATSQALMSSLKSNIRHEYARLSWNDVARKCMNLYKQVNQKTVGVIS